MSAEKNTTYFHDLTTLLDSVHQFFNLWEQNYGPQSPVDPSIVSSARVAVHEWLANLVRHADFQDRKPEVSVSVVPDDQRLKCVIRDNSEGFNLNRQLQHQQATMQPLPERGMGLIWIFSLAEDIQYSTIAGNQSLEFYISVDSMTCFDLAPNA